MAIALVNGRVLVDAGFARRSRGRHRRRDDRRGVCRRPTCRAGVERQDLGGAMLVPGLHRHPGQWRRRRAVQRRADRRGHRRDRRGASPLRHHRLPADADQRRSVGDRRRAIAAVDAAIAAGVPGVLGIHIEGPFLNLDRKGIHAPRRSASSTRRALAVLTSLKRGRTLVTLAPERTSPAMIRALVDAGVIVAAGHSNATYEQTVDARRSRPDRRHPFVQRDVAADRPRARRWSARRSTGPRQLCGIIVDGHHVDPATLRVALRCKRHGPASCWSPMRCRASARRTFCCRAARSPSRRRLHRRGRHARGIATSTWPAPSATPCRCSASIWSGACAWRAAIPRSSCGSATSSDGSRRACARTSRVLDAQLNVVETWIDGRAATL